MSVFGTTKHSSCNTSVFTLGNKVISYCMLCKIYGERIPRGWRFITAISVNRYAEMRRA